MKFDCFTPSVHFRRTPNQNQWLKDAGKSEATTKAPWSKRNATATAAPKDADTSNGVKKEVKLQSREIKVPVVTTRKTSVVEPLVKPKAKETKQPTPESSSEYEDSDDDEEEEDSDEEESASDDSASDIDLDKDEDKHKMPITVKLKPVERPVEVKKSPSVDRAGKFVKPALKKVPTLDKLNKPRPPPATIPEKTVLRPVPQKQFELPEPKDEEKTFVRPPLRKTDSISKKCKWTLVYLTAPLSLTVLDPDRNPDNIDLWSNPHNSSDL